MASKNDYKYLWRKEHGLDEGLCACNSGVGGGEGRGGTRKGGGSRGGRERGKGEGGCKR